MYIFYRLCFSREYLDWFTCFTFIIKPWYKINLVFIFSFFHIILYWIWNQGFHLFMLVVWLDYLIRKPLSSSYLSPFSMYCSSPICVDFGDPPIYATRTSKNNPYLHSEFNSLKISNVWLNTWISLDHLNSNIS